MPSYLSETDHAKVTQAVRTAEEQTSGEIVTVLADRSDGYSDIALSWAAFFAFTVLTLAALFPDPPLRFYASLHATWNAEWSPGEVFAMASGMGILTFLVVWLLQFIDAVRFAMVPRIVKRNRVFDRAVSHFKVGAERRTHGRTGVLLYLSMREHRAEIVADETIAEKVDPEVWGEAMVDMLVQVKKGDIAGGLVAGIRDVGAVLAEHFPRHEDDQNELPDRLIEL